MPATCSPRYVHTYLHPKLMFIHSVVYHQFQRHVIEREFEGKIKSYETWCRPLWSWVLDHLLDPEIVRHFEWDAQKISRYDGKGYTQIFTEPWTGTRFWDVQVGSWAVSF